MGCGVIRPDPIHHIKRNRTIAVRGHHSRTILDRRRPSQYRTTPQATIPTIGTSFFGPTAPFATQLSFRRFARFSIGSGTGFGTRNPTYRSILPIFGLFLLVSYTLDRKGGPLPNNSFLYTVHFEILCSVFHRLPYGPSGRTFSNSLSLLMFVSYMLCRLSDRRFK